MPRQYEIDAVRFSDESYTKEIDRILLRTFYSYYEAVDALERFMKDASFKHIEQRMRHLRKKEKKKTLVSHMSLTKNLHGYLGPGGYNLRRIESD